MLLGALALSSACWGQGEDPPGDAVGSFDATGLMVEQSCGSAIPAPDPLQLTFDLRAEDGGRAYWFRQGQMFAGIYKEGEFTFTVSQSWMVVQPDRFRGYAGCSVTQRDTFTFLVEDIEEVEAEAEAEADEAETDAELGADAGVTPTLLTLSGSQTTEIEPLSGSDCRPAVVSYGGSFLSMPCRVEYVLTGSGVALVE
mgnify:FL=1